MRATCLQSTSKLWGQGEAKEEAFVASCLIRYTQGRINGGGAFDNHTAGLGRCSEIEYLFQELISKTCRG